MSKGKTKSGGRLNGESTHWLIRHAALSYANQWFETDRKFMHSLIPPDKNHVDSKRLGELAGRYMVARGFKKDEKAPTARWQSAAAELENSLNSVNVTAAEIHDLADRLGCVAPVREETTSILLSAATKFLWFAGRHNVRILDKRAVVALTQLEGSSGLSSDYERYAAAWDRQFAMHLPEIQRVMKDLPGQLNWTCIPPHHHNDAKVAFQQPWFLDRIFDKYLWTRGATEWS